MGYEPRVGDVFQVTIAYGGAQLPRRIRSVEGDRVTYVLMSPHEVTRRNIWQTTKDTIRSYIAQRYWFLGYPDELRLPEGV